MLQQLDSKFTEHIMEQKCIWGLLEVTNNIYPKYEQSIVIGLSAAFDTMDLVTMLHYLYYLGYIPLMKTSTQTIKPRWSVMGGGHLQRV